MIHAFGGYELDLARYELRHRGHTMPVEPQVFNVLAYLVEHRDRVVSKEELLDNIWGNRFVSESALTSRIKAARRAIGDDGSRQALIRTAHGRGYRFVGTLTDGRDSHVVSAPKVRPESHLAGRRRELAELNERLAQARLGDRQVVFVAGAPGIGKTRVVEEFLGAVPPDVLVGVGQCVELRGAGEAYLPILEAIRQACEHRNAAPLVDRLADRAPSWVLQLPGVVAPERADELRARSIGAAGDSMLRELLDGVCSPGPPLVLALEDLHWSDESTLDLLDAIAADRRPASLLVVATHRPSDGSSTSHTVHALAVGLRLRQRASLITLDALAVDEVGQLVSARVGGEADSDLVALIHERTGGVPLFAEHLIDDWLRVGWLEVSSGTVVATKSLSELADTIPDGIRLLIEHGASRLPTPDQTVLAAAAVAGRSFTSAEVATASGQPDEDVEAVLAELARRGVFINPQGEITWPDGTITSSFSFDHDLYREVLQRQTGPARAGGYHLRIGARLEDANQADLAPVAANLAVHFASGGDLDRAVRYRTMAADHQLRRSAHREAINHLHMATDLLTRLPDDSHHIEQALHVQIALGNALLTSKGYAAPETADAYDRAHQLGDRLGDGAHVLPVLYGMWNTAVVGGQPHAAVEVARAFLDLAERTAHDAVAVAHRALGWPLLFLGRPDDARTHLEQIPATIDRRATSTLIASFGEDPAAAGWAALSWARWLCGDDAGASSAAATALERATAVGHPLTHAYVLTVAAVLAQMRNDPRHALRFAQQAVELAGEHDIPVFEALAMTPLAWASRHLAVEDRVALQKRALAGMARTSTGVLQPCARATLAELLVATGDLAQASTALDEAHAIAQRTDERYYDAEIHRVRAEMLVAKGDLDGAIVAAATAVSVAQAQGARPFVARAQRVLNALANPAQH